MKALDILESFLSSRLGDSEPSDDLFVMPQASLSAIKRELEDPLYIVRCGESI